MSAYALSMKTLRSTGLPYPCRGQGDSENMSLANVSGQQCRDKPKDLLEQLQGLCASNSPPTAGSIRPVKLGSHVLQMASTQGMLLELAGATQTSVRSFGSNVEPNLPDSSKSAHSRPTTSGKSP